MRSTFLRKLDGNAQRLRRLYLPKRFSKTGNYTSDQYLNAAAFRILIYAELEEYIESFAQNTLEAICNQAAAGKFCAGSTTLMATFANSLPGFPSQIGEIKNKSFLGRSLGLCKFEYTKRISANKGARANHILNLFVALGVDETSVDLQLLIDLNTLGA
ncbi:MAG TPA: hypothetical protein VGE65_07535, partial [Sphingobium sp.]